MATNVNTVKMTIQIRRDTWANWQTHKDIKPAAGEPCFVTDKNILKIGDGTKTFEELEPIGGVKLEADGKSIVLVNDKLQLAGFDPSKVGAQPRVAADGSLEWVMVPTVEAVTALQTAVTTLQFDVTALKTDVADLRTIVGTSDGTDTLLSRVEDLEREMDAFVTDMDDDGKVETLKELIEYVGTHGEAAAQMASDITTLKELVGDSSVDTQILDAIEKSDKKAQALYEHAKYEIADIPVGTLVDYRDKEIRVMVPTGAEFAKQAVGAGGDTNSYYMTFKTYAPNDNAVGYREHLGNQVDDEILTDLKTDKYGRKYQPTWLSLAKYDEATGEWSYNGKDSTVNKYIGWDYRIDWYDANGIMIASDSVRINLSNESCHYTVEPYYAAGYVKEIAVNGVLMDIVNGMVDITVENTTNIKSSDEITVNEDGTLSIKSISFDKVVQGDDSVFVMDGGGAV